MTNNYYFCHECKEKIDGDPYVQKWWSNINQVEFYHVACFVVAHKAHIKEEKMNNVELLEILEREWKSLMDRINEIEEEIVRIKKEEADNE